MNAPASSAMQLVVVTGLSGSGKSVALDCLEDSGFYCIDNLPVTLIPESVKVLRDAGHRLVAVSADGRSGEALAEVPRHVSELRLAGIDVRVLYLEAHDDTLVKRFSETRRRHPLSEGSRTLPECIALERERLARIGTMAHRLDTSELRPNALRQWIKEFINLDRSRLTLLFQSFGFKHGLPLDADLVFDVRCLPNPHYDPVLRPLSGRDQPVIDFLARDASVRAMYVDIRDYVERWLPYFVRDNRAYLTVAVGCTGGQHRSVYLSEQLGAHFAGIVQVLVRHRNLTEGPRA